MKKKKISAIFIVPLLLLTIFQITTFAATLYDTSSCSWTSENASYGPDDGWFAVYSYDDSGDDYCKCKTQVVYNSSNVSAIRDYYDDDNEYPGLDITNMDDNFDAYSYTSTLPDPYFDVDNDFPYSNGNEESEVTCESPYSISSDTEYNFIVYFDEMYQEDTATFQLNTSESYWSGFWGEYQTDWHSQLGSDRTVDMP